MQGSVVGFQLFQSAATQKRTYFCHECRFRLGLGGFQLLRLDFFFYFVKFLLCLLAFGLQLLHVGFKLSRLPFQVMVVLGGGCVPCFRTSYATLQSVLRHRCGIAVVVGDKPFTGQEVIGTQTGSPDKYGGRYAAQMKYGDEKQRKGSKGACME